jgi:lysyl endopeptidase
MSLAYSFRAFRLPVLKTISLVALMALAGSALAGPLATVGPIGPTLAQKSASSLPALSANPIDEQAARAEDLIREDEGLPPRFAIPEPVSITPDTDGVWEDLDTDFQLWRLRVHAPGALSLNFGFTGYDLPKGARLSIYPVDMEGLDDIRGVRVFDESDNDIHGELWTPVLISNDVVIELLMPAASRNDFTLELGSINSGYRFFGEDLFDKSGSCNNDVVCPEGDDWRSEINTVGVISTGGSTFCTGSMLNNTAEDGAPYFLTANHCGINTSNDQSLVVYWNFQSPTCGQHGGGTLDQFQTGSTHLASNAASDFTLVLMDDPVNPDHNVTFAGWDRSTNDPTSAVAIHHPNTDEKSISFEYDPTTTTSYLSNSIPGDSSHIRVTDWDDGTTEPGSSGSPLFDQNHRVVGQLHGGYASCSSQTSDWYGRLSMSFPAIAQYLDPLNSGAMTTDTLDPGAVGLKVTPGNGLVAQGNAGGPFTPSSITYTLVNQSDASLNFSVTSDVNWADVTGGSGTINVGGSSEVTVSLNSNANSFGNGGYNGRINFTNMTDGEGDTFRPINLQIGVPEMVYSFDMSSDPDWDMQGQWAFGVPTGGGGNDHGGSDPTSGATGSNVIGYNLNGDYTNDMSETHLTTLAIDCSELSAVSVKFQRYLNVEQPSYDHAYVKVSTDGSSFTTVWENTAEITDSSWSLQEIDLSSIADGASTLYVRWTMGTTDSSWLYSGWNIDDVEIWGLSPEDNLSAADDLPGYKVSLGNHPNPFNPMTKVSFGIERDGHALINIYNVQGQLVRRLVDGNVAAGLHQVTWDGRDEVGLQVGSGVYFARLVSGGQVAEHKMVLLK